MNIKKKLNDKKWKVETERCITSGRKVTENIIAVRCCTNQQIVAVMNRTGNWTRKDTWPKWVENDASARPSNMTLIFNLLTTEADRFMLLPGGPLVPIFI